MLSENPVTYNLKSTTKIRPKTPFPCQITCNYSYANTLPTISVGSFGSSVVPTPSGGLHALTAHYHGYSPNMNRSDCHAAIPPPRLFSLLEASVENSTALPSSYTAHLILCHGLRPRRARITSPIMVMRVLPSEFKNTVGHRHDGLFRGSIPSLSLQPQYPIPLSSRWQVTPPSAGFSSEEAANLSSGWTFTNWPAQASLGALLT